MVDAYEQELVRIFKIVVNEVAEEMYEELMTLLDQVVYTHAPSVYRSGDVGEAVGDGDGRLAGSFFIKEVEQVGRMIQTEIYHDPRMLDYSPGDFVHGSKYWDPNDARPYIAQMIIEGSSGPIFGDGWWTVARDFWTPFIKMKTDGTMDKMFKKHFKKYGINVG